MKCNNKNCSVSSSVAYGEFTFGSGELDSFGYWQYPCVKCAREYEIKNKLPLNTCWPFTKDKNNEILKKMLKDLYSSNEEVDIQDLIDLDRKC